MSKICKLNINCGKCRNLHVDEVDNKYGEFVGYLKICKLGLIKENK